nr:MAG TPA: hypothetical protein [Caudoviricetes sp.]
MTHLYHFQDLFVYTARILGFPPFIVPLSCLWILHISVLLPL